MEFNGSFFYIFQLNELLLNELFIRGLLFIQRYQFHGSFTRCFFREDLLNLFQLVRHDHNVEQDLIIRFFFVKYFARKMIRCELIFEAYLASFRILSATSENSVGIVAFTWLLQRSMGKSLAFSCLMTSIACTFAFFFVCKE